MITVIVRSWRGWNGVIIRNQDGHDKAFTFHEPAKAQVFLENLYELLPFLGLEYQVQDARR